MKSKNLLIVLLALVILTIASCKKSDLFEQPTIEVTGYTLTELPGEYAYLEIDMLVTNNDTREADILDVVYTVVIEGVTSELEEEDINKKILVDSPLELTLPLTLKTKDAIELLSKLDKGEELNYSVTGTFHVDEPGLKKFDLPINITGSAFVDVGFDDFYKQPQVTTNNITGIYLNNGTSSIKFDFDVDCTIKNMDTRGATIDEVEYVVYIEGLESAAHLYSDAYSKDFSIAGEGTKTLTLPVTLTVNTTEGNALIAAIEDGTIDYTVEGIFHIKKIEENDTDFNLPLYLTGNTPADFVDELFEQPTVEVVGYTLKELPGEYTYLDVDILVTNNDEREALIKDIEYLVTIEGIEAELEEEDINQTLTVDTPLELTLPITLVTNEAIELLSILNEGEELEYVVTGTFHVDEPVLDLFDLPIDIQGSAYVEIGYEDFFLQPNITVNSIDVTYSINFPPTAYTFYLDVNSTIENMDTHSVIMDEVEYIVTIETKESDTHYWTDAYPNDNLELAGESSVDKTLPVTLNLNITEGAALVQALADGNADYIIEGTGHAIDVEGTTTDFFLPIYDTGTTPVTVVGP